MGIWDKIKGQAGAQFLDVIDWTDERGDTLLFRFPTYDRAITDQSKLIVREGQQAVFLSGGAMSQVFTPGTYTLDTPNAPIRSFFATIGYGLDNPYKGEILFVSTKQHTDNGWGTQNPFMLRDAEFGPVRVRAFGTFSFRVTNAGHFVKEIAGTEGHVSVSEAVGQIKKRVVSAFVTAIGKAQLPVLDLAAHYMDIGDRIAAEMGPELEEVQGIGLTDFTIANISLPPEVEKALDTRSRMGILGNLDAYTKMQAADAIGDAARNPGMGGLGTSMGVGMGLGGMVGQALGGALTGGAAGGQAPPTPPTTPAAFHYEGPSGRAQLDAAGVLARVQADPAGRHLVWQAGWAAWKPIAEVPELANQLPPPPHSASVQRFHYAGPDGQLELDATEIAAKVQAAPEAKHHVWQTGWPAWRPAAEVPAVAAHLGPPPPPTDAPPPPPTDGPPPPPE